jgi:hypothetical protein
MDVVELETPVVPVRVVPVADVAEVRASVELCYDQLGFFGFLRRASYTTCHSDGEWCLYENPFGAPFAPVNYTTQPL